VARRARAPARHECPARAVALRAELDTRSRADTRAEFFALARDAARRALGERPYDEQVIAALALDHGTVVEMQTGEGKTLTATMPVDGDLRGRRHADAVSVLDAGAALLEKTEGRLKAAPTETLNQNVNSALKRTMRAVNTVSGCSQFDGAVAVGGTYVLL
jgi:hypothetical protein